MNKNVVQWLQIGQILRGVLMKSPVTQLLMVVES